MQLRDDKIDIMKTDTIVGCLEMVDFPELAISDVLAKVDTGAFSGALHCTRIRVVRRGVDKQRVLKFCPLGLEDHEQTVTDFEQTYIRSSTGHRMRRHIITTTMVMGDRSYTLKIGLSDRSDMRREALIGRRFLRENDLLVDVRKHSNLDDEGEITR